MFLRLLSLVLVSAPIILATLWFSGNPGQVVLEWLGWRIETNVPILLLVLLVVFAVLFVIEQGVSSLTSLPGRLQRSRQAKGVERGLSALIESLDAAAAGDVENGRRLAAEAVRHLHRPDLAERLDRLMPRPVASAIASSAKTPAKKKSLWAKMTMRKPQFVPRVPSPPTAAVKPVVPTQVPAPPVPVPETVPEQQPDLSGLIAAIELADWDKATELAGAASSKWKQVVQLGHATALAATQPQQARQLAGQVLAADPANLAAVRLAVRLGVASGDRDDVESVLKALWCIRPTFDMLTIAAPLWGDAAASDRLRWIETLVKSNPEHADSHLALGAQAVADGQWGAARLHLVASIKAKPSLAAFQLMMQVEEKDGADNAAIEMWRRRAADAAPSAHWRCGTCDGLVAEWSATCPHCAAVGTLV